jgi:formate dehydrogenase subunit gamma
MSSNIVVRHGTDLREDEIVRYTLKERMAHWISGVSYVYLLLTGLALFTPYLYWIALVLGGGATVRFWHPVIGLIFFASVLWMHNMWSRDMKLTPEDKSWQKTIKHYVTNRDDLVEPAGHFNAGQKQFYWIMFYATILLVITGLVLWFPEKMPRDYHWVLPLVVFLHVIAALATIAAFMIHVYMGLLFVSGGLQGILWGRVPVSWAKTHHRLWFDKMMKEDRGRITGTTGAKGND